MSLTDKKYRSPPALKALVKTRSKLVRENNHAVETPRMTLSRILSLACAVLNYPHRVNLNACQGSLIEKKKTYEKCSRPSTNSKSVFIPYGLAVSPQEDEPGSSCNALCNVSPATDTGDERFFMSSLKNLFQVSLSLIILFLEIILTLSKEQSQN